MEGLLDILSWALIIVGGLLCILGAVGTLRLPDTYARMHAAGLIDTGATFFIVMGLMIQSGFNLVTVKLIILVVFLLFTSPTTTHALARALIHAGIKPKVGPSPNDPSPATARPHAD